MHTVSANRFGCKPVFDQTGFSANRFSTKPVLAQTGFASDLVPNRFGYRLPVRMAATMRTKENNLLLWSYVLSLWSALKRRRPSNYGRQLQCTVGTSNGRRTGYELNVLKAIHLHGVAGKATALFKGCLDYCSHARIAMDYAWYAF